MKLAQKAIKKNADLVEAVGANLAKTIAGMRKGFMKRLPSSVTFHNVKPQFYLDDGGMLRAYAVDLVTGEVLGERYCGSADSALCHPEQFNETATAPANHALVFVESFPSSGNHPWAVTIVTQNLPKQLSA